MFLWFQIMYCNCGLFFHCFHSSNTFALFYFKDNAAAQQHRASSLNTLRGLDDFEAEAVEIFI